MMTKKNLAKAVTLSVLLMLPYGMAQAATLTEQISVSGDNQTWDYSDDNCDIDIEQQGSGVSLSGNNSKLFLGEGNITMNNSGTFGTSSILRIFSGDSGLLIYEGGKLTSNGNNEAENSYYRMHGVMLDSYSKNSKIILGYNGNYDDLDKYGNTDSLNNLVNSLNKTKIYMDQIGYTGNNDTSVIGISFNNAEGSNLIVGGDTSIFLNKNTDTGSMKTYGIYSKVYRENTNNLVVLKSANMEIYAPRGGAGIDFDHRISSGTSEVTLLNDSQIKVNSSALGADVYGINAEDGTNNHKVIVNTAGIDIDVEGNGYQMEYDGGVFKSDLIAVKSDGGVVNINGFAELNVTDVENNEKGNGNVFGLFATNGGNITINGKTTINTTGEQDIVAVVAGTENWTDVNAEPDGGTNNINLNYGAGSNIKGDIISGYGGNITIGNTIGNAETGISTLSTRNNAGTLKLTGDALSANGGKLSINLTSGSTWTGRADDYQDADLKEQVESGFLNPKFSHEIAASGTVNVNLGEGAKWDVTGQSWLTKLEGTGGVIDMRNGGADDTSHAVHIGDLEGSHTFVMDLDTEHSVSDMLFIKGNAGGEQKLWINSINGLENLKDGDSLRFATVNSAGLTFSGDYNFGSYENAKNGIMLADNGVMNNAFVIKSEKYDVNDSKNENEGYNGTEFDEVKPGDEYVDKNYADATNWLLAKDSSGDKVSDAGKTIINMSKVNYNNAIYMDRLNKRIGEARYISPEDEQGMWVRIRHDRIGKDDAFRSQNTMYEMGYDVKQDCDNGERRVGMAIDYMDGKAEYTGIAGDGDVKRYGLWLYDTWLGDKGHYTDYVLKWGHLENDFDIMARTTGEKITGDYSNNVFSASAEYGKKNDMGGGSYFEPQAQLQFARVTGADYVTSQDTKVSLDGINSLIGRAGFRLGRDLNENSTVYIKADLLHEFLGDQDITATDITGTLREEYENEGTWYDVGFGFATALGNNSYAFMDFEKSFGNDNDETYQINAGVQWTF